MKKICLLPIFLWLFVSASLGQESADKAIIEKISLAASKIQSLQCDFVQTKELKMLNEKMVSNGLFTYQQTDKLRWEYTSPYKYTFVLNGSQVFIKKGERADKIDVNQSKVFKEIAQIMMNTVVGKALNSSNDFEITVSSTITEYVVTMIPQRKDMRKMFKQIKLHFNIKAEMVQQIELTEQNGDTTVIVLKNVRTNESISSSAFSIN